MPVVKLSIKRITDLLGISITQDELSEYLFRLKAEVEGVENGYITIEINSDRPDMLTSEGVARALKGLLGIEIGSPKYIYRDVDSILSIDHVPSRRYIAMGFVFNVDQHIDFIEELIQFQEKIHATYGRDRRKIAIGIHDADKLDTYDCRYTLIDLDTMFVPLYSDKEMSIKDVLRNTPQGKKYGSISIYNGKHPAILCGDEIISLPPVINADITRIENSTRNILIDVTGTDYNLVRGILDLLTTTIAEASPNKVIGKVIHIDKTSNNKYIAPTQDLRKMLLDPSLIGSIIGVDMDLDSIAYNLRKMRFDVDIDNSGSLNVHIPQFRLDVSEPVDLIEDIAIAVGYSNIEPQYIPSYMPGRYLSETLISRRIRDLMIGLGYTEIYSHVLMPNDLVEKFSPYYYLRVSNPVSSEMSVARPTIILSILNFLKRSQYDPKPIKVFEIGEVIVKDPEHGLWKTELRLSGAIINYEVGFEDIQSDLYALMRSLKITPKTVPCRNTLFIEGRCGLLIVDENDLGILGEINLDILEDLGITYPIVAFEIILDSLIALIKQAK